MNSLAMMEIHKLTRLLSAQQRVVTSMETAAKDFLTFYPDALPRDHSGTPLYLLIGSERGFCGDYHGSRPSSSGIFRTVNEKDFMVVAVGHKFRAVCPAILVWSPPSTAHPFRRKFREY